MLKGNLSTRPFYNERLVTLVLAVATAIGVALTVFNVMTIYRLSAESTRQSAEQDRTEKDAARISAGAAGLQQSLDRSKLLVLANATREANSLIDQRTFSWTAFFGLVEKTLPQDARLVAVSPRVERGVFRIAMIVNAKAQQELEAFIDALLGTGAFYDLLPAEQQRNDDGSYTATISGSYLAPAPPAAKTRGVGKGTDRP